MKKTTLAVALVTLLCMQGMKVVAGKAHVSVTNHLQQSLLVRCESSDDTLGPVTLQPSAVYAFSFTPNVWGNTMFRCTFDSDAYGRTTLRVWQGWLWTWRRIKCYNCDWVVTPNGFSCNGQYLYSWKPW